MDVQAHIPAALCILHNFIHIHDPSEDLLLLTSVINNNPSHQGYTAADECGPYTQSANACFYRIAMQMWDDYLAFICNNELEDILHILDVDLDEDHLDEDDLYDGCEFVETNAG
ncbi:uncharacterized protein HD556DRAFT_1445779 [Suillus plorans]|uniref:Uncharacterized protein n=1 Tax=Suillus plorans TaxID=116603 RepID=A0A9P7AJK6_9AGAM|nr:uncharacterized protein HD556DRAFT_1445779 [Suillus plorans]KAG1790762.1 hypothetical protein HD556DRAFT_1445779 [Suillus plorans]